MRSRGAKRARSWSRAVLPLCLLTALSPGARSSGAISPSAPDLAPAELEPLPSPRDIRRDLDHLLDGELHGDVDVLWNSDPSFALQVVILRAGRDLPPTVPAARRAEREELRAAALGWLRVRLEEDLAFRERWSQVSGALLADLEQGVLWRATARTVGRLQEHGLARAVASGLASERPGVAHAARAALFDLYLRWFDDAQAFREFSEQAGELCDGEIYRGPALEFERQARELSIKLMPYEPQRAIGLLDSPDPRLRAAAARVLGGAINGESEAAVGRLLEHLASEVDAEAFQATVEALLESQAAALPEAEPLVAMRARLLEVLESRHTDLQAPAAYALGRTPWSPTAEGEASILVGLEALSAQLERLSARGKLTDRDVLVTSLQALWTLGDRAVRAELDLDQRLAAAREVVLRSIREEREFEGVRVAAARLLPIVGRPRDIAAAVEVMNAESTSAELGYTLLGDVGEMARGLEAGDPAAQLVLDTLLGRLSMQDPDLRRRALSYLSDPDLAALTSQADPSRFIQGLGVETLSDLQAQLLTLVGEYGRKAQVRELLELSNFDDIANSGPAGISSLVQTLKRLAQGDSLLVLQTAERLLAVDNDGTRVARLREALELVAELDAAASAVLPEQGHDAIVAWARELRQSAGSVPGGEEFLRRLVDVHVPACSHAAGPEAPNLAHLQALFLSDLVALDPESGDAPRVLAHFEAALAFAVAKNSALDEARVLRDRARFLLKRGQDVAALADYRAVFASQLATAALAGAPESVLDLADLRGGGELVAAAPGDPQATAREALSVSLALVRREAWTREPAAVRMQDLRDLAARATRATTLETCDLALPFFAGLPELPPPPVEGQAPPALPPAPAGAAWGGLLTERAQHEELLALSLALRTRRAQLEAARTTPPAPDETEDPPAPAPDESDSPPPDGTGDGTTPPPGDGRRTRSIPPGPLRGH